MPPVAKQKIGQEDHPSLEERLPTFWKVRSSLSYAQEVDIVDCLGPKLSSVNPQKPFACILIITCAGMHLKAEPFRQTRNKVER